MQNNSEYALKKLDLDYEKRGHDLKEVREIQIDFLKKVFPNIKGDDYVDNPIEIRFLLHGGNKVEDAEINRLKYQNGFNVYDLPKKFDLLEQELKEMSINKFTNISLETLHYEDKSILKDLPQSIKSLGYFIYNMNKRNGLPFSCYYSLSTLKKEAKFVRTRKDTIHSTYVLPMDFDNITKREYIDLKKTFWKLELEPLIINSGHGYQMLLLLDEASEASDDMDLYKRFTNLLKRKGFKVDDKIVDRTRVFRLPGSFNAKKYDRNSPYKDEIAPYVTIEYDSDKRYSIKEIFDKIETLPDKIDNVKKTYEELFLLSSSEIINHKNLSEDIIEKIIDRYDSYNLANKIYPEELMFSQLCPNHKKMLTHAKEGVRDDIIMHFIPYFKNYLKLDFVTIQNIFILWNQFFVTQKMDRNELKQKIQRLLKYRSNAYIGKVTEKITERYGSPKVNIDKNINSDEFGIKIPLILLKNLGYINYEQYINEEEEGIAGPINHKLVKHYILLKSDIRYKIKNHKQRHEEELSHYEYHNNFLFDKSHIMSILNISESSFYRDIKEILNSNISFLEKIKKGKKSYYRLLTDNEIGRHTYHFPIIYLKDLNRIGVSDLDFVLFLIIKKMMNGRKYLWLSQRKLGAYVSMTRTTINKRLKNLKHLNIIDIEYKKADNNHDTTKIYILI